ncbi:MAG: DNA cytosine methyltransferase [Actinomycetota bacterium]|nr:DNA cytosine methyltransferase [Actinomycetota bacterium]
MGGKASDLTVTDQFCGAGGSSIGAAANGFRLRLAMNHWRVAIETHNANFPFADHVCADVSATDPRRYPSTQLLLTSPECTNHSMAKKRPTGDSSRPGLFDLHYEEERSRATMWDVPRFTECHRYEAVVVENVVEAAKWSGFRGWWVAMSDLGYRGEAVFLSSAHVQAAQASGLFPAPQYRDRMYVVWTRNDVPRPDLEFRPSCWCPSCERMVEGYQWWKPRTKAWPVVLERWGKYRTQYFYRCGQCHTAAEPMAAPAWTAIDWTITGQRVGEGDLKPATLARIRRGLEKYGHLGPLVIPLDRPQDRSKAAKPATSPFDTLTARQDKALAWSWRPFVASLRGGGSHDDQRSVEDALTTVTASGTHHLLVAPDRRTSDDGGRAPSPHTGQGASRQRVVRTPPAFVVKNYGGADEARYRAHGIDGPFGAVTAADSQALVTAPSVYVKGYGDGSDPSMAHDMAEPLGALTAQDHHAVVNMPFTVAYYGHGQERRADAPIGALTSHDRYGVAQPDDTARLEDCRFRMLEPHELGRAMAFPDDYKVSGNKRQRVRQYGNAVTPPVTAMLTARVAAALA